MKYFMDKFQRLLLINQFELLAKIDKENKSHYEKRVEILKEGYEYHYDEYIWNDLYDPMSKEDSQFVLDVLTMYRDITWSKSHLDPEEQEKIKLQDTFFPGFDYNDPKEGKLANYAEFYIKKIGRFPELIEDENFDGFNSHDLKVSTYERYLANYNKVKSNENYEFGKLSADLLNQIFEY